MAKNTEVPDENGELLDENESPQVLHQADNGDPRIITVPGSSKKYRTSLILVVVLMGLALTLLQVSTVNVALAVLPDSIGASAQEVQWVISGYALAIGLSMVPMGRIGDLFGRSLLFVLGLALFSLSSFLCAISTSGSMLVWMRILQGFAAGIFSPQTAGIIQQYFSGQARALAYALMGLVVSVTVALGPMLTGLLIAIFGREEGWRLAFSINLPLGLLGVACAILWLPFKRERIFARRARIEALEADIALATKSGKKVPKRPRVDLDPVGMILLGAAVIGMMLPFVTTGSLWRFVLIPAAFAVLAGWVWWERAYEARGRYPMVSLRLFKIPSYSFASAIGAIQFLGMPSVYAINAMFLQNGFGETALIAGLSGMPGAFLSGLTSIVVARYTIKHGRSIQAWSLVIMLVGVVLTAVMAVLFARGGSVWLISVGLAVLGFGSGSMGSANQTQAMLEVPPSRGGIAGGIQQTGQRIFTAIGTAILTGVFFSATAGLETTTPGVDLAVANAWSHGYVLSFAGCTGCIVIALVVAIIFVFFPRQPHPTAAKK
ncbi:MFS transporter [Mobiluncus curtisii]|uniref:Transporter, major facilitator family protein n=2 Tax=Mobiluncus curtisii TaxID=2051 RepID=D6ZKT3_MOBCV|nr:MFS transporter [Mobiluncus curtisii]ADI67332.1 transporter, major facilitator family protein [Mobiluncus curtisii ATCC 43063]NMW45569.1 MFS transporter [Mobiluncus curtisii]QQU08923.1 MFS transporter [Mobiluncus curtisii]SQB65513.1 Spectinomycin tetracycline efflux pump [Mobiluncus curtisii]